MKTIPEILNEPIEINKNLILQLISLIDLTTLNNTDTVSNVMSLVNKANKGFQNVHPAAICTFANFGSLVRANLLPPIKSAVVGGCFPIGQTLGESKIQEIATISALGIDEIDVVMNRGDFFNQEFDKIADEISGMKAAAKQAHLKVILETGELETARNIRLASEIAIKAGADFIKTSTGKTTVGANPEAVYEMCHVIKSHFEKTGQMIGIKPSGGIRTLDDVLVYYKIVTAILGEEWLNNTYLRIGASSLYDNLIKAYNNY